MGSPRLALVGTFVGGGLLLFAVGLFLIGDRRLLFAEDFEVEADFGNVTGIVVGTSVRLAGLDAGEVLGLEIPSRPGERFGVRMRVREDLRSLVRTDSVAAVLTDGLLGAVFIQIRSGTASAPQVEDGGVIRGVDSIEIADLIEEGRDTFRVVANEFLGLREQMSETFSALGETAEATALLINDASDDIQTVTSATAELMVDVQAVLTDTRSVVSDLSAGRGTIGKLLSDEALYTHLAGTARETEATMKAVRGSAERVEQLVRQFGGDDSEAADLLAEAGDVVSLARHAMSDLAENTEAIKRNWLFRGFFSDRGFYNLDELALDEYRELVARDRYTPLRIWLAGDLLFDTDLEGRVSLAADAGQRLDEAMSELLGYPRDSPLIVEGYAAGGGRSQEFIRAQAQADVVRDYLVRVYGRVSTLTGTMPIGAEAAGSPSGDNRWDGVALTLLVDPERLTRGSRPSITEQ